MLVSKSFLIFLLTLTCQNHVFASNFSKNANGTTGAQFLELPVGACAIAMGTAAGALNADVSVFHYNPAAIASLQGTSISLMHSIYFQDISYQYAALSKSINIGTLAVEIKYLSYNELEEIDNAGNETGGAFTPRDIATSLGYGIGFGKFDFGISGKYISSQIQESAHSYAVDSGIRIRVSRATTLGISVTNIGKGLKYIDGADSLPTTGRLGSAFKITDKLLLSGDIIAPKGAAGYFAAGTEYAVYKVQNLAFFFRAGYNGRNFSSKLGGLTGFSAGAGFGFGRFTIDYGWTSFGDLGNAHRISLGIRFVK
ncbi:MAG: hypothetical protein UY62_C0012G0015 [Parcubacteria group bacterium GW2011_GWF2_50_9]|nr:MAG: hypothetical protein UY62_C0012G0015 [Parcubacteria group bacterium GW2011_GWF2_50_9]